MLSVWSSSPVVLVAAYIFTDILTTKRWPSCHGLLLLQQRRRQQTPVFHRVAVVQMLQTRTSVVPLLAFPPGSNNPQRDEDAEKSTTTKKAEREEGGPLDFLFNPYESSIPKELETEIYAAEANAAASQGRNTRVTLYACGAFILVLCAFFNGFLTEIRTAPSPPISPGGGGDDLLLLNPPPISLDAAGFGWVESNFVWRFLFMNKIGGGLALLSGAMLALLAEAEYDTRRINAEKIWEELQQRRKKRRSTNEEQQQQKEPARKRGNKKKRMSGKEMKRLGALSEVVTTTTTMMNKKDSHDDAFRAGPALAVVVKDDNSATVDVDQKRRGGGPDKVSRVDQKKEEEPRTSGGLLGTMSAFYEKADSLAASQALLLNKMLEDRGIVDKITDESGLRVIGREAAVAAAEREKERTDLLSSDPGPITDAKQQKPPGKETI